MTSSTALSNKDSGGAPNILSISVTLTPISSSEIFNKLSIPSACSRFSRFSETIPKSTSRLSVTKTSSLVAATSTIGSTSIIVSMLISLVGSRCGSTGDSAIGSAIASPNSLPANNELIRFSSTGSVTVSK